MHHELPYALGTRDIDRCKPEDVSLGGQCPKLNRHIPPELPLSIVGTRVDGRRALRSYFPECFSRAFSVQKASSIFGSVTSAIPLPVCHPTNPPINEPTVAPSDPPAEPNAAPVIHPTRTPTPIPGGNPDVPDLRELESRSSRAFDRVWTLVLMTCGVFT
jgi:hypothetical protein